MCMDYQKLYAYLEGQVDKALELLEDGDLVKARPVRELLQDALLKTEEMYVEGMAEVRQCYRQAAAKECTS